MTKDTLFNKNTLEITVPTIVVSISGSLSTTDVPEMVKGQTVEQELIYSATASTASIVDSISKEIDTPFQDQDRKQILEIIDNVKTYISELSFELSWHGIKFNIKRSPRKTIKNFVEENS